MSEIRPIPRSPSIVKRILDHKIEIENEEQKNKMQTCCNTTSDKRLLLFIASFSISSILLIFSCYKLSQEIPCSSETLYVGILTMIIGLWIPSPVK